MKKQVLASKTEIFIIIFLSVLVFFLSGRFDLLERIMQFVHAHENYELDELIPVFIFLLIAFIYLFIKRSQKLIRANREIKHLQGIIPICSVCKKIRDEEGFWQQIESYISSHSDADFSHGICNDCARKMYGEEFTKKPGS